MCIRDRNISPLLFADLPASVPDWVPDVFTSLIKIFILVNVILGLVSYTCLLYTSRCV